MKAWVVVKNAEPGYALALQDVQDPPAVAAAPKGSDILVRITHAALNPADLHFMLHLPTWIPFRRNAMPGLDFAGEIVKLGPMAAAAPAHAAAPLTVGARVSGCLSIRLVATGHGSLAEYITVPAEVVVRVPDGLSSETAVGMLGCAGQTAHLVMTNPGADAVFQSDAAKSRTSPPRVLINGASGGVGSLVTQIAKARGAYVVAVCSAANEALVRRNGADEIVDYQTHDPLPQAAKQASSGPFDLIVDCMGDQPLFLQCSPYLVPRGSFLCIVGGPSQGVVPFVRNKILPWFLGGPARTYQILGLAPSGERARAVAAWYADGTVKDMPIDSVHPMADAVKAYGKLATKRAKGKIVIKVQE
ncbi:zinc alcohol dehydrogenase [Grosmannia clavigera kw1407]|uniref:Zinc alcohol dehydrogenase n=1 Tax=Grosmannia clavigera (strain kw1407 / UAMH 11150) TaxID=655863 RepID=F0XPJ9_GROCL|nr:zinc alcohol dehydrogenase [Grosmannia clavigera kw1407]EFX00471.1 zinc alcohol dehydrogenase [Grosmannia clavigera kw1407]